MAAYARASLSLSLPPPPSPPVKSVYLFGVYFERAESSGLYKPPGCKNLILERNKPESRRARRAALALLANFIAIIYII